MAIRIGDTLVSLEQSDENSSNGSNGSEKSFHSAPAEQAMSDPNNMSNPELCQFLSLLSEQLSQQASRKADVMPDPERYDDSDRTRYSHFHAYLNAKLETDGPKMGSENVRVWYALGRLSGQAAVRMTLWADVNKSSASFNVSNFLDAMDSAFSNKMSREKAVEKLSRIRQGKREFSDFVGEFDRLLLEAGSDQWAEVSKIAQIRNALNDDMKDLLVSVVDEGRTYAEFCSQLHSIATKLESRKRERSGRPSPWTPVFRDTG